MNYARLKKKKAVVQQSPPPLKQSHGLRVFVGCNYLPGYMMLGGNMGPGFQLYRLPISTFHLSFSAFELRILVGNANNT